MTGRKDCFVGIRQERLLAMTKKVQSLRGHVVASYGRGNLAFNVFICLWGKFERGILTRSKYEITAVAKDKAAPSQ